MWDTRFNSLLLLPLKHLPPQTLILDFSTFREFRNCLYPSVTRVWLSAPHSTWTCDQEASGHCLNAHRMSLANTTAGIVVKLPKPNLFPCSFRCESRVLRALPPQCRGVQRWPGHGSDLSYWLPNGWGHTWSQSGGSDHWWDRPSLPQPGDVKGKRHRGRSSETLGLIVNPEHWAISSFAVITDNHVIHQWPRCLFTLFCMLHFGDVHFQEIRITELALLVIDQLNGWY